MDLPVGNGLVTQIDSEDYARLVQRRWYVSAHGYVVRSIKRSPFSERIHRVILNAPRGVDVDHVNGNKLDNRKSNLRLCTVSQNLGNTSPDRKNNRSGFKGVSWCSRAEKWRAAIRKTGRQIHIGLFDDPVRAAAAYNVAAIRVFGDFARLNRMD